MRLRRLSRFLVALLGAACSVLLLGTSATAAEEPFVTAMAGCLGGQDWSGGFRRSDNTGQMVTCSLGTVTAGTTVRLVMGENAQDSQVSLDGSTWTQLPGLPTTWTSPALPAGAVTLRWRNGDDLGNSYFAGYALTLAPAPTPTPTPTPTPAEPTPTPTPTPAPSSTAPATTAPAPTAAPAVCGAPPLDACIVELGEDTFSTLTGFAAVSVLCSVASLVGLLRSR